MASIFIVGLAVMVIYFVATAIDSGNRVTVLAFIGILVIIFDFVVAYFIFVSNRAWRIKVSWLFIVMGVPFFGVLIFGIFGIAPFTKRSRDKYVASQKLFTDYESFAFTNRLLDESNNLASESVRGAFGYGYRIANRPVYSNNDVRLISDGRDFEVSMLDAIASAKSFIHLQSYIATRGRFLSEIGDALIAKAKDGVKVRFLYDWVGSAPRIDKGLLAEMRAAGVETAVFNPSVIPFQGGTNFRSHRKVLIVDNRLAITGGCNLADEYVNLSGRYGYWRDTNIEVRGESVNTMNILFASDWQNYTGRSISEVAKGSILFDGPKHFTHHRAEGEDLCQVVDTSPDYEERQVKNMLLKLIASSTKRIWMSTPYFLPSDDIAESLRVAAYSGVDVRIITPGQPDNKKYVLEMTRDQQRGLLSAGVKFYEFQAFTHSKTFLFDDELSLVGTFNLDYRSLYINFESGVLVGSRTFNAEMAAMYEADFANSKLVTQDDRPKPGIFRRFFYLGPLSIFYPLL